MTRRLFFRTAAVLITAVLVYVWLGVAWINGDLQPWIYELAS